MHGSDISETINTRSRSLYKNSLNCFNIPEYLRNVETIHIKILQYMTGAHIKKAVIVELRLVPLYIYIIASTFRNYKILATLEKTNRSLLSSAFSESLILHGNKKQCWVSGIYYMLDNLKICYFDNR